MVSLVDAIATFIAAYRAAEFAPTAMLEAVLATFPTSTESDFALGLIAANRKRAMAGGLLNG